MFPLSCASNITVSNILRCPLSCASNITVSATLNNSETSSMGNNSHDRHFHRCSCWWRWWYCVMLRCDATSAHLPETSHSCSSSRTLPTRMAPPTSLPEVKKKLRCGDFFNCAAPANCQLYRRVNLSTGRLPPGSVWFSRFGLRAAAAAASVYQRPSSPSPAAVVPLVAEALEILTTWLVVMCR